MSEVNLNFQLHPAQSDVFNDPARFKIVVAGRRFGKSYLAAINCLIAALQSYNKYGFYVGDRDTYVFYVAPTFDQAKQAVWQKFQDLGRDVIVNSNKNEGWFELLNGRQIRIKGADRPETLRGAKLSYAVVDEMANMKPDVWESDLSPALTDVRGEALIIGTPEGKNHFYQLHQSARKNRQLEDEKDVKNPEWAAFQYRSVDNPFIEAEREMKVKREQGWSEEILRQEYEANFHASGGKVFSEDDLRWITPEEAKNWSGVYYISVDPAGYEEVGAAKSAKDQRLDETAISVVKAGEEGWLVEEIISGRWNIRETALRIIRAAQEYRAMVVGIESGSLKNAILPYLHDKMRELNIFPKIEPVSHGGKKKQERIAWALQGRMQNGRIALVDRHEDSEWQRKFINQLLDFPNPLSHDDMLDSLAYVDQVSSVIYDFGDFEDEGEWQPLDPVAGV